MLVTLGRYSTKTKIAQDDLKHDDNNRDSRASLSLYLMVRGSTSLYFSSLSALRCLL